LAFSDQPFSNVRAQQRPITPIQWFRTWKLPLRNRWQGRVG